MFVESRGKYLHFSTSVWRNTRPSAANQDRQNDVQREYHFIDRENVLWDLVNALQAYRQMTTYS